METVDALPLAFEHFNAHGDDALVAALHPRFEHAPWVARETGAARPFANFETLHAALVHVVRHAPRERQAALLRGWPELAGKEIRRDVPHGRTGPRSDVGLDTMLAIELSALKRMNHLYRDRHGFPFIVDIGTMTKHQILDAMRRRLQNPAPGEFDEALTQVCRIARSCLLAAPRASRR